MFLLSFLPLGRVHHSPVTKDFPGRLRQAKTFRVIYIFKPHRQATTELGHIAHIMHSWVSPLLRCLLSGNEIMNDLRQRWSPDLLQTIGDPAGGLLDFYDAV
jgi:hypothetical protein